MTVFDRIKALTIDEMSEFIRSMVDEDETHEVACYGCVNYGTHHSDPKNKGTNLYECDGCPCEGMGLDVKAWLNSEAYVEALGSKPEPPERMTMRLIDAHSLIMPIALYMTENAYLNDTALDVLKMVAKWVETEPTIEAEPVRHGRWEAYPDDAHMKCSACGMEYLKENMPKVVG